MPDTSLELTGATQIMAKMERLDTAVQRTIATKSLREGLKPILTAARRNAPVGIYEYASQAVRRSPGTIKRGIKIRAGKRSKTSVAMLVGVGKKWFTGDEWYAAFVEFGHKTGKRSRGLGPRRQVAGEHFIEYSYDEQKDRAKSIIQSTFLGEVERQAAL
jgi:HK97 gp10 family phage protein